MNKDFIKNNYIVVRDFLTNEDTSNLCTLFKKEVFEKNYKETNEKDSYVVGESINVTSATCFHNIQATYIKEKIEKIIETNIWPTYCYARVYKPGNILERHKDKVPCEISITLHLEGDSSWPIWIETPQKERVDIELGIGDAMIYLGCNAYHGRDEYKGTEDYIQVFMHYIRRKYMGQLNVPRIISFPGVSLSSEENRYWDGRSHHSY
jgi:hypothetical protein